jgi:hypothetical protein
VIDMLDRLVDDIASLNSKLVLLVGPPRSGKTQLLAQLSARRNLPVLHVGATLGRQLLAIPSTQRHLLAPEMLKQLASGAASDGLLLLDDIELLFDSALRLSPLDLLKQHAHARRVAAVWPGEFQDGRLSYATTGHPEHQDYGIDGLVPFKIQ